MKPTYPKFLGAVLVIDEHTITVRTTTSHKLFIVGHDHGWGGNALMSTRDFLELRDRMENESVKGGE